MATASQLFSLDYTLNDLNVADLGPDKDKEVESTLDSVTQSSSTKKEMKSYF